MKRLILVCCLFLASLTFAATLPGLRQHFLSFPVAAQTPTDSTPRTPRQTRQPLDNFDIRADLNRALPAPPSQSRMARQAESAAQEMRTAHPRTAMRWSSLTGTPSRLLNLSEALTPPSREAAEIVGRRFVKENRALFRLQDAEVDGLKTRRQDRTAHNGVTHLTYEQQVGGIDVFQGRFSVHVDQRGAVIAADGELMPEAASRINRTDARLSSAEALLLAGEAAEREVTAMTAPQTESRGTARAIAFGAVPNVASQASARLVYFPLSSQSLQLAWEFTLWMQDTPDVYLIVIDAERGSLLFRHNYTTYENPHGLVYTGESPRPNLPQASTTPPVVERQDLPFNGAPYFPPTDKHFDWWNGQSQTTLISNNTDTHLDRTGGVNVPDEPRLTAPDSNFSFPIDFTQAPTIENNQKAAQVNLFYWINRYHDILYSYGFTESAGNFQTDNFGLGGLGNDAVQADAQDGSGTNNANFTTTPDGTAGRVQMYLWTTASPQLDGDLDQGVIIHELTHGLSNRLIGNGGGLTGLQGRGMGEGWSDYVGLVLLSKASDSVDGKYAVGQYVFNNYNVGIRRYPYSTDKAVNPLTFANISLNTGEHRVGEIWCLALWEMRAGLVKKHGFTEGQRQSLQLVVDGMKLTPGEPTFLDARDAILLADRVNNNGANQCVLWDAFAKRGLGFSATTLGSGDAAPKEAFDPPPFCNDAGTLTLDRRNYLMGENLAVAVADRNAGAPVQVTLSSATTGDQETLTLTPEAGLPGSYKGQLRLVAGAARNNDGLLQVAAAAGDPLTVRYNDQNTGAGAAAQVTATANTAYEKTVFLDTVEQGNQGWIPTGNWGITNTKSASSTRSWTDTPAGSYANNSNFSLTSPPLDGSNLSDVTLQFAHSYSTESGFDYCLVEASTDDGVTWQNVAAFSGTQLSFNQVSVKLNSLNNQPRGRVRFRLLSDPFETADGWYLDDIRLTGRSANRAVVNPSDQRAPQILALSPAFGAPAGGTKVTLTGANFTDTADTTLTFDGVAASALNVVSATVLTANTPPHAAGAVVVRLKNKYGEASLSNGFAYYQTGSPAAVPLLGQIFPASGSTRGGLSVTITGVNFTPETTVSFGGQPAIVTFVNANAIRAISPVAGAAGAVDVSVSNVGSVATAFKAFTYVTPTPPTVQVLTPTAGQTAYLNGTLGISWNSSDNQALGRHRVSLFRDASLIADLAAELPGNSQSLNWLVPATQTQADNYRIRVVATDDEGAETEAFSSTFSLSTIWQSQAVMPSTLLRVITASDGQYLYGIGGRSAASSTTATNLVRRFDPSSNTWTSLASLPVLLSSGEAVHLNGKIYVLGGQTEAVPLGMAYIYDIAANSWAAGATAPTANSAYAIGTDAARGIVYVTGGLDSSTNPTTTVSAYDTKTNTWSSLPRMATARYAHEAAFIEGKLYVAGGAGIAGGLASGEVYDPATQQWSNIAPLNRPRGFAASTAYSDTAGTPFWLVVGGQDTATATTLGTAELYDVRNNRWTTLANAFNLLTTRTQINGVALGNYFYVLGGGTGSASQPSPSAANERLKLPLAPSSSGAPPVLAVPPTQIAIVGNELGFNVTASDLNSTVPLALTATGVPAGASFTTAITTNNSTSGTFRWTPVAGDAGRSFAVNFRASDGSLEETRTVLVKVVTASAVTIVNAAHYRRDALASDAIASAFGENLALRTESAVALPLPTELAGTQVLVNGIPASLLYVSPTQINFIMPSNLDAGTATIIVSNPRGSYAFGTSQLNAAAPSIFTADASGRGDAAALATIDGLSYVPAPFAVAVNGKPNILVLFGTGFRHATASNPADENGVAESVRVTIDGVLANVLYAGAQGEYVGLDQLNVELPATLQPGARRVEVVVTLNGVEANRVTILLK